MAVVSMKQLLEAGVHFGHQTRRWNPKMRRFIFGERNGIYIVDLHQTLDRIDTAYRFVRETVADGGTVLFVGTKKQAQEPIENARERRAACRTSTSAGSAACSPTSRRCTRVSPSCASCSARSTRGEVDQMSKKEGLKVRRDLAKLERNLGGIKNLEKLPSAVFVIDTKKEHIAVTEANRLAHPGRRGRRHQLRSRHHRLRDPRQRRRDPFRAADVPRDRRRGHRRPRDRTAPRRAAGHAVRGGGARPRPAKPQRTPEEEAEFQRKQAEARAAAAAASRRRSKSAARAAKDEGRRPQPTTDAEDAGRRDRRPTSPQPTETQEADTQWLTSPRRTSRRCARSPAPG